MTTPTAIPIRYRNDGVSQDLFVDADGHRPRLAFPTPSRKAVFHARPHVEARELPDDEFPLVLNTGRLQHQWHTMTKTGRVDKLNRLDSGPFVELHPSDAAALGISDGQPVELASRRGRAVLPAVVTENVRPGNCFAPFHWNDEHGANLTVNALTNDAVDADSLQPEFKACAVRASVVGPAPERRRHTVVAEGPGPLVLWASQTGNAEDFAARLARRLGDSQLVNMDDVPLSRLATARDVLVVTSTFGDGGPPDNGTGFWDRLGAPDAPVLDGVRYAVLGIGDRSYADFCGHAKSIDGRLAALGASKILDRADCEAYDNEPMSKWADDVADALGVAGMADSAVDEPFTRADPIDARLCRNTVLSAPLSSKEVRQFGFDISSYDVGYATGDSLGVCAVNSRDVVDAWLTATGLVGTETVEVDGVAATLREALTRSYDICRVTPDLLRFVAENCAGREAAKMLRAPSDRLKNWLAGRNGLDIVERVQRPRRAVAVAAGAGSADTEELLDLVEPAGQPRRGAVDGVGGALQGPARGSARRRLLHVSGRSRALRAHTRFPAAITAFSAAEGRHGPDDHGRARHGDRTVSRIPAGAPRARSHRPQLAVLRRTAAHRRLLLPR